MENNTLQDIPAARKVFILNYIKENGSASIKDLSILQNVSEATIRSKAVGIRRTLSLRQMP